MMYKAITLLFLAATLLSSCSESKKLAKRITGTWNVTRYETTYPNGEVLASDNLGTVVFNKKGTGNKDLLLLSGAEKGIARKDNSDFTWRTRVGEVIILSNQSDLAKTWLVMRNKKDNQLWKSTTGGNVQTIELKR